MKKIIFSIFACLLFLVGCGGKIGLSVSDEEPGVHCPTGGILIEDDNGKHYICNAQSEPDSSPSITLASCEVPEEEGNIIYWYACVDYPDLTAQELGFVEVLILNNDSSSRRMDTDGTELSDVTRVITDGRVCGYCGFTGLDEPTPNYQQLMFIGP